jgi:exo-beta-1,3-glucanase (GH17 family)
MNRSGSRFAAVCLVVAAACSSATAPKGNNQGSASGSSGANGGSGNSQGSGPNGGSGTAGPSSGGGNGSSGGTGGSSSGAGTTGASGSAQSGSAMSSGMLATGDGGGGGPPSNATGGACAMSPQPMSACTGGATGTVSAVSAATSCWGPGDITLGGAVTVPAGVTLTINPGTTINGAGPLTAMGGTIKAMGSAAKPVFLFDTSIALVGGSHTFQYTIINSSGATAIDASAAQVSVSHVQIQKYAATGLSIHGAGAKATIDFSTFGTTTTLFSSGPNGTPTSPAVAVAIDAAAGMGGTSITNSSLGFLQDALNNGLSEAGPSNTHLAYDFISGTANAIVTTDKTGVVNAAPGIADIPNLNHNLGPYAAALDLADPTADYSKEPAPNGGRANIGYYGGTECATPTTVQIVSPNGCGSYTAGSMQTVTWHASPDTPAPGSKTLSFSSDGGKTWSTVASIPAGNDPNSAMVAMPNVTSANCLVRISQDNDPTHIVSTSANVFAVGTMETAQACVVPPRCPAGTTTCKPFLAICYEGYRDGQEPGGVEPTCDEVQQDLNIMLPYTHGIRTYGSSPADHDGMCIPGIADQLGLDFHMGIWVDNTYTDAVNYGAIDASVGIVCGAPSANGCPAGTSVHPSIKTVIVGNEFLLRVRQSFGDTQAAEQRLVSYIKYARARIPSNIEVVTAESYPDWLTASVNLYNAVDRIIWHSHPWWEQIPIAQAASHFAATHDLMTAQMKAYGITKAERCGETGWPWDVVNGAAIGSEANEGQYLHDLNAYSASVGLEYWFFEGFDESWKIAEGPVGGKWGLWTATRPATGSNDQSGQHQVITNLSMELQPTQEWP